MSRYGVIKFQAPFERLKEYDCFPEVRLFKAIVTQAIIDVSNNGDSTNAKKLELEAKNWIFGNSHHFKEICYRANIEPNFVIKLAKGAIKLATMRNSGSLNSTCSNSELPLPAVPSI